MNIAEILITKARETPDFPALIETRRGKDRVVTFAELDRLTAQAAGLLCDDGLCKGDPVLVLQPMSIELYVALLAIFRLGLVAVFLDPSAGREHIERCCGIVPPRGLIGSWKAHWLRLVSPALRRIPHRFCIGAVAPGTLAWSSQRRRPRHLEIEPLGPEAPALITLTSGSTGEPKAAVRTHGFLVSQHTVLHRAIQLCPGEVDLGTLPIFILANLASGVTSVIADADLRHPGAIDPRPVIRQIRTHRPSRIAASPAFLERLLEYLERKKERLHGFTKIYTGGGPVFPDLLERLQRAAPGANVVAVYGSTEAEPIAECAFADLAAEDVAAMHRGGGLLAGKPVAEIEVRIIPDHGEIPPRFSTGADFAQITLPSGEAGEIVVRGDHVLNGYLHGHGDSEIKLNVNGQIWHRTGDAGYFDASGRLWLFGRCSAAVRDNAGAVYPLAAEGVTRRFPWVRRCALAQRHGKALLAVEARPKPKEEELNELRRALTHVRVDDLVLMQHIPVDSRHNAKIDYPQLYRQLGAS